MQVTRLFEFDSGHRIPNHNSECKNLHGHRYKLELTLSGDILKKPDASFEGMVLDFSDIKKIAKTFLDTLDHAFLVYAEDTDLLVFLKSSDSKYVIIPEIPTVENLTKFIFKHLESEFKNTYNESLKIKKIKLWETPNCYAELEF